MKHLLVTILVALLAVPTLAARDPDPRRGVRRMLLLLLAFTFLYVAFLTLVHANSPPPSG